MSPQSNSIILEGMWGIGKSTLAIELRDAYNFRVIPEPIHPRHLREAEIKKWYLVAHRERQEQLKSESPVVLERCELSTFAFDYACSGSLPDIHTLADFSRTIASHQTLLTYIESSPSQKPLVPTSYDERVTDLLQTPGAQERYRKWYTHILPFQFGIVPFIVDGGNSVRRRVVGKLAQDINRCIKHDRIAQVNCVVYRRNPSGVQILILRRRPERGDFWQTVTGGIHIGEELLSSAQREVLEETGLQCKPFATFFSYSFMGNEGYLLHEYAMAAEVPTEAQVHLGDEHSEHAWVHFDEACARMNYEDNRSAIRAARFFIEKAA